MRLYNDKRIPFLKLDLEDALKLLETQEEQARNLMLWLLAMQEQDVLDDPSIASQPAVPVKGRLEKLFLEYEEHHKNLMSALELSMNRDEDRIIQIQAEGKAKTSRPLSSSSVKALESTLREINWAQPSPIKIEKPNLINFSWEQRDFTAFKRKFYSIVVPRRADADTGLYLQQAIPKKYEHLIQHVEPNNYVEMIGILEKEFGSPKLIVDSVINELNNMQISTTDCKFIEQVERV